LARAGDMKPNSSWEVSMLRMVKWLRRYDGVKLV
jgi:hypothetical protein